jgi:hypothetical protein
MTLQLRRVLALSVLMSASPLGCSSSEVVVAPAPTAPVPAPPTASVPEAAPKAYVRFLHAGHQYFRTARLCLRKDGEPRFFDLTKDVGDAGVPQGSMTRYFEVAAGTYSAVAGDARDIGCGSDLIVPIKVTVAPGYSTIASLGIANWGGSAAPRMASFVDDVTAPSEGRKIRALNFAWSGQFRLTLYTETSPLFPDLAFGTASVDSSLGTVNAQGYLLDTSGRVRELNTGKDPWDPSAPPAVSSNLPPEDKKVYTAIVQGTDISPESRRFPLQILVCPDEPTSESDVIACKRRSPNGQVP